MYVHNSCRYSAKPSLSIAWRDYRHYLASELDRKTRDWLLYRGSLTQRLIKHSESFRVEILSQRWGRAQASEAWALGVDPRSRVLIREVALVCNDEDWVYARSILPDSSLRGPLRHLRQFDNRSLGAMLFRHPTLRRGSFEVCRLQANHPNLPQRCRSEHPDFLWGRRSIFFLYDLPLLVGEIFLPRFVERQTL